MYHKVYGPLNNCSAFEAHASDESMRLHQASEDETVLAVRTGLLALL
jgi:hypothetical protein